MQSWHLLEHVAPMITDSASDVLNCTEVPDSATRQNPDGRGRRLQTTV
jgi:hypothetical protein